MQLQARWRFELVCGHVPAKQTRSIQNRDGVDFDVNAVHREGDTDERVHGIIITEEFVVDGNLFAFEGMPLVRVGHEHGQLADVRWLASFGFDHARQSVEDDSQLFHGCPVLRGGTIGCAAGEEQHVASANTATVMRAGRIDVRKINASFFHG